MIEMILYGRGGQGGVTLAKLIATIYFRRGKDAQAFGVYAAERSGAPIQAFVRIDDQPISNHNQIRQPDHVIVLDPTLIGPNIVNGLDPSGWIVLNTPRPTTDWTDLFPGRRLATIDATSIAVRNGLGTRAVPIVNTTMIGAIARVFELGFDEVSAALAELGFGDVNLEVAREAFETVSIETLSGVVAVPNPSMQPPAAGSWLHDNHGGPPAIRTGSWATQRPARRTLTPPCNHVCPAGNDVQAFVDAIGRDAYDEALAVLLETMPIPGVCGRVCPAPCMDACNRIAFDDGINVRELERYAADHARWPEPARPWRTERVAVIGSGPAGLSAAYQLARLGYHVSLFEASDELGGLLRNGIPEYRLPREVLDRELGFVLMHGITAYTDAFIDRAALQSMTRKYYAIFVATGLQEARALDLDAGTADFVMQGLDFLDRSHRREVAVRGERVVVVGGGNTAIDAARTARRLGAESVHILYRRTREEMPAIREEVDAALEEGIVLDELVMPLRLSHSERGARLTCARVILGAPDETGRRSPVEDERPESRFDIACDRIILALGQSPDLSILHEGSEIRENGRLLGLAEAPVFIGGDFRTNEGTVAAAIGSGRRAAWQIHKSLSGEDLFPPERPRVAAPADLHMHLVEHAARKRGATIPIALRETSFAEVHLGLADATDEARRCFSCGVCNECDRCITHCPEGILTRDGEDYRFNYDYCKGCGVCASECPRGVIVMAEM